MRVIIALSSIFASLAIANAAAIVGCVSVTAVVGTAIGGQLQTGLYTQTSCNTKCSSQGLGFSFFNALTSVCYCSNIGSLLAGQTPAVAGADPDSNVNICGNIGAQVVSLNTAFQERVCALPIDIGFSSIAINVVPVLTVQQCLDLCVGSPYAVVNVAGLLCTCGVGVTVSNNAAGICDAVNSQVYFNTIFPTASRSVRKRELEARRQKPMGLCPERMKACLVPVAGGQSDGSNYECIDVDSELESCGGCMYGAVEKEEFLRNGRDCSSLPGVSIGGSTCLNGACRAYSCSKGWSLKKGICHKL